MSNILRALIITVVVLDIGFAAKREILTFNKYGQIYSDKNYLSFPYTLFQLGWIITQGFYSKIYIFLKASIAHLLSHFLKVATTLVDLLFIELMSHLSLVKQM